MSMEDSRGSGIPVVLSPGLSLLSIVLSGR